jgi:hypothetical protein
MVLSNIPFLIGKAAIAVTAAYVLARELVPRDVLSATFVAMLCISPTVYTGLRRGLAQLAASALGGLATLAVTIPLGPGPAALAASVVLGLAAAFLVGFAATYTVAGFTVLYVSLLGKGEIDAYVLRLASVMLGVGTAGLVNVLVSAFWYRQIFGRRVAIAARAVERPLALLAQAFRARDPAGVRAADDAIDPVFRLLAELSGEFHDLRRELSLRRGWGGVEIRTALRQERAVAQLELVCHHARDLALVLRELYREAEGIEDVEVIGVPEAVTSTHAAVAACAARLRGETVPLPAGTPARYDPMLRRIAARIAEGDPQGMRLELALCALMDVENLSTATAVLVGLVEEMSS